MKQYTPAPSPVPRTLCAQPRKLRQPCLIQLLNQPIPPAPQLDLPFSSPFSVATARSSPPAVLQRKVGFEFETGWLINRQEHDEEGKELSVPFQKKDVVSTATTDGFRMEADEAGEGKSEIEFVVRPPVDENAAGYQRLQGIMDNIRTLTDALCQHTDPFFLNVVTHVPGDNATLVQPCDTQMHAGPQATSAIRLDKIREFMTSFNYPQPEGVLTEKEGLPADRKAFSGFAAVVGEYVRRAQPEGGSRGFFSYPKIMAEPLLSRTDFTGLFRLIEPGVQTFYCSHPELWVEDVLQAASLPPDVADKDMLGRGVVGEEDYPAFLPLQAEFCSLQDQPPPDRYQYDEAYLALADQYTQLTEKAGAKLSRQNQKKLAELERKMEELLTKKRRLTEVYDRWLTKLKNIQTQKEPYVQHAGFTVREWLNDILLENSDRLTTLKDAESMGEFGNKTEGVGPAADKPAGIFEWRGDQTTKIPATQWKAYALGFMEKIGVLHEHPLFPPVEAAAREESGEEEEKEKE